MNDLRNMHPAEVKRWRAASCQGKTGYTDGGKASRIATQLHRRGKGARLMTYRCRHCGMWHVGRE